MGDGWLDQYGTREEAYACLVRMGIISNIDAPSNDPTVYIGTAVKYARKHKLEFYSGLTSHSIKVVLPREAWLQQPEFILPEVCGWTDRPTVQQAVCDCLMQCRELGLL